MVGLKYHIMDDDTPAGLNKSLARLIQKIYEAGPNLSQVCGNKMRITLLLFKDYKVIKKILRYLGINEAQKKRSPPKIGKDPNETGEYIIDDYIDSDHVCQGFYRVVLYRPAIK
jgi:hypothetical protein